MHKTSLVILQFCFPMILTHWPEKEKKVHAGSHKRERKKIKVIKSQTCSKIKVRCFIFFFFHICIKPFKVRRAGLLGYQWFLLIPMRITKERWAPRPNVSTAATWKDKKNSGVFICMHKVDIKHDLHYLKLKRHWQLDNSYQSGYINNNVAD